MDTTLRVLTLVSAVGAGLSAGAFGAFSTFVMTGLRRAPAPIGARAMQEINRAAPTPTFMLVLFGTGVLGVLAGVAALLRPGPATALVVGGAVAYCGCLLLTVGYHVPRNAALAALDPTDPATAADWATYLTWWTRLNHVRTLCATVGSVLFILAT